MYDSKTNRVFNPIFYAAGTVTLPWTLLVIRAANISLSGRMRCPSKERPEISVEIRFLPAREVMMVFTTPNTT